MKQITLGSSNLRVPAIVIGCMRLGNLSPAEMEAFIHNAVDHGTNYFDHADIYAGGESERVFGAALNGSTTLRREDLILQSKCGIRKGFYDLSKEYILQSTEDILRRLQTDYLDVLLLHRPDALVEPEEIAAAFDSLYQSGKVRHFGVSNHKPMQIKLLKKYVQQPLLIDQLQLSLPVSNMIANGMEVNMDSLGSADRDGSVLDYCRLHDLTVQAWSPFQKANWQGTFLGSEDYPKLNREMESLAARYGVSAAAIAAAWILRHPANIQLITGSANPKHIAQILAAGDVTLTREEWYRLYLAADHPLP